LGCISL
ncbi:ATP-dependent zinc metalloprotease FtsH, partial [Haemophilus influenzae]